jgi:hypothetical protein
MERSSTPRSVPEIYLVQRVRELLAHQPRTNELGVEVRVAGENVLPALTWSSTATPTEARPGGRPRDKCRCGTSPSPCCPVPNQVFDLSDRGQRVLDPLGG